MQTQQLITTVKQPCEDNIVKRFSIYILSGVRWLDNGSLYDEVSYES